MIDPGFILRAIENGPMTTAAIADYLNADYGDVRDQIGRLLKAGRLKVYGHRGGDKGLPSDRIPIFEAVPAL